MGRKEGRLREQLGQKRVTEVAASDDVIGILHCQLGIQTELHFLQVNERRLLIVIHPFPDVSTHIPGPVGTCSGGKRVEPASTRVSEG